MLVLLMMFFSSLIQLFTLTNYDNSDHESYVDWITNHSHPQDITLKCTHGKELMSTETHPIFYLIFFVRIELTRLIQFKHKQRSKEKSTPKIILSNENLFLQKVVWQERR